MSDYSTVARNVDRIFRYFIDRKWRLINISISTTKTILFNKMEIERGRAAALEYLQRLNSYNDGSFTFLYLSENQPRRSMHVRRLLGIDWALDSPARLRHDVAKYRW